MKPAGARRHVVSVEQHNGNAVNGQPTFDTDSDWKIVEEMISVPASYEAVSGGETIRGLKIEADATGVVTVPSTSRTRMITPNMRLRLRGRKLNVLSNLDIDGRMNEQTITVKEKL